MFIVLREIGLQSKNIVQNKNPNVFTSLFFYNGCHFLKSQGEGEVEEQSDSVQVQDCHSDQKESHFLIQHHYPFSTYFLFATVLVQDITACGNYKCQNYSNYSHQQKIYKYPDAFKLEEVLCSCITLRYPSNTAVVTFKVMSDFEFAVFTSFEGISISISILFVIWVELCSACTFSSGHPFKLHETITQLCSLIPFRWGAY